MCVSAKSDFADTYTYIQYIHILTYAHGKTDFADTYTYIQYIHILTYAHGGKNMHTYALSVCACISSLHTCNTHIHFGIHTHMHMQVH
jgi:hypothetical protein